MRFLKLPSGKGLWAAAGVAALALLAPAGAGAAARRGPVNLDLEEGEPGKVPTGWVHPDFSAAAGYKVQLTDEQPRSGKRCALVSQDAAPAGMAVGKLGQSFDAAPYRGKRVRLRAAVRAEVSGPGNQAQLFVRVDRPGEHPGFLDNMADRPIAEKAWRDYELLAEVSADATSIELGLLLAGSGRAWLDAVSFEVVGKAGEGNEAARPLTGRGLDNVVAFTRLLGYVRYFHPSDEAAATNWDRFAIDGVRAVEGTKDAAELARVLEELFRPVAPSVRVFPTAQPPAADAAPASLKGTPATKVVAWYHLGVATGFPHFYSSVRVSDKQPVPAPGLPEVKLPDPAKPLTADLGAGVSCRVPLALHADEKGTLPRAAAKARASSRPMTFVPTGNDRATRLAAVALAWNIPQHFYPYFDAVKADWPAELRRALAAAATDADERAFLDTLSRLVAGLHDGHGQVGFLSPGRSSYPPLRWDWVEDRLVVTRVAPKGADGLKPGDVVLTVNGRPAAAALAEQEERISGATPQYKRHCALTQLARGPAGSEIVLEVQAPSGEARAVRVRRTLDSRGFAALDAPRRAAVETLKPGVMYVDLDRVTDAEFKEALPLLEKATGIVYDLRGYPALSMAPIARLLDRPASFPRMAVPISLYPDRQNVTFFEIPQQVEPEGPRFKAKAAILTDGRAISQAESWLSIVEHYKLAAIVGDPTAGTNGDVNPFVLPGGYQVFWTGLRVQRHDGSRHHGVGIRPTVPVARTIRSVAEGRDEVLERAIAVVSP